MECRVFADPSDQIRSIGQALDHRLVGVTAVDGNQKRLLVGTGGIERAPQSVDCGAAIRGERLFLLLLPVATLVLVGSILLQLPGRWGMIETNGDGARCRGSWGKGNHEAGLHEALGAN